MTQEFHISVTPVGQNDYLVRTEQVAPGVPLAEELVKWPVADWLTGVGNLMNDPLTSVLQGEAIARNSVNLVALGQQLYNELFQGTLRDSWITAQGIAQNHQQVLRLRLGIKDSRLARLPWEVMHAGDRPIATGPYIAFSRYQAGMGAGSRLATNMPVPLDEGGIHVLMVIASPTDLVRLDLLKQEAVKLQAELERQNTYSIEGGYALPQIELTVLEQPGREELTQTLEQGRFHILHYSGHSNTGVNGGEIYLVNRRTGLTETLTGDDLAGILVNNNIQVAVFNSCFGAYGGNGDGSTETGERNLTDSLIKRGIRSVLAMSERIPDEVALTLTQLFYRNLSQGYPIDLCVSRMRQGLVTAYGAHQMYWALPVLYLQAEFDGYLNPGDRIPPSPELMNDYGGVSVAADFAGIPDQSEMALPIDGIMVPELGDDGSELGWLGDSVWDDLMDDIDEYDDSSYVEDSAIVSDLFRQLDREKGIESTAMGAELISEPSGEEIPGVEVASDLSALDREVEKWREARNERVAKESGGELSTVFGNQPALKGATQITTLANQEGSWNHSSPSAETYANDELVSPIRRRRGMSLLPIGAMVGVGAIALAIGLNWWNSQQMSDIPEIPQVNTSTSNRVIDVAKEPTGIVTEYAMEKLSAGDLERGLDAVDALLNRNALSSVEAALRVIPSQKNQDPRVNFYRGRLAWQSVQTGDKKYSYDDARRYWESAVKSKPDSLMYVNALAFAYYAEGKINNANNYWFQALNIAAKEIPVSPISNGRNAIATTVNPKDALTAYAGLALGLYKSSQGEGAAKREQYLNEAVKLRRKVIQDDPESFQPKSLAQNWLWTESAIQDWRSLLQISSR